MFSRRLNYFSSYVLGHVGKFVHDLFFQTYYYRKLSMTSYNKLYAHTKQGRFNNNKC